MGNHDVWADTCEESNCFNDRLRGSAFCGEHLPKAEKDARDREVLVVAMKRICAETSTRGDIARAALREVGE